MAKYKMVVEEQKKSMQKTIQAPPPPMVLVEDNPQSIAPMPPSKRNKMFAEIANDGRLCFCTIVSGVYQWYIPLFRHCAEYAYPLAAIKILIRGKCELPAKHMKGVSIIDTRDMKDDGYTTAALRFVWDYQDIEYYDYALITDIDLLHRHEITSLFDQRMMDLSVHKLDCYSNYVSAQDMGEDRMPGVHFVTKDWWKKTAEARKKYLDILKEKGPDSWSFDERMITKIVRESGLNVQKGEQKLWQMHGLHLGDYRRRILQKEKHHPGLDAHDQNQLKDLLESPDFMMLVEECSQHIPTIKQTFDLLRKDVRF
jgi:hypothetical protein